MSARARRRAVEHAAKHGIEIVSAMRHKGTCPRIGAGRRIYVGRHYSASDVRWGVNAILHRERVAARHELNEAYTACIRLRALGLPVPAEAERRLGRAAIAASDRDWAAMMANERQQVIGDLDRESTKQ
jgi:hypothetical protein